MKKIFSILIALVMFITVSAQNYEYPGTFGMPYVNINAGGISVNGLSSLVNGNFNDFINSVRPTAGLEFGTYFTPVWGMSVEGMAHFNTTGSYTLVDQSTVLANAKSNISNFLAGYKGYPRRIELIAVAGIGWGHDYGQPKNDPNYVVYNTGLEFNANLGVERAWQISLRPTVLWNNYDNNPKFNVNDGQIRLTLGITYKFGNRKIDSHNFVVNDYTISKYDYDLLLARYEECVRRDPIVKEIEVEKLVEKTVTQDVKVPMYFGENLILFEVGSAKLNANNKELLKHFSEDIPDNAIVYIIGSADSKTGTESFNYDLAGKRANSVKNELIKLGVNESNIVTDVTLDGASTIRASRSASVTIMIRSK